jgi:uncharacterized protein (DUF1501 family)
MHGLTRRLFLRSLSAGGVLCALGRTPGTVVAEAAGVDGFSDYKALVCVFLLGGNDSWSMIVPRSDAEYAAYATSRQNLAIAQDRLLPIELLDPADAEYGVHPSMPGLQMLFETARCAVVANIGPLVEPVTLEQYRQGTVRLPPQLFSHNDQQDQWHTLCGDRVLQSGWAGRIADLLAQQTSGQQLPLNVSLNGATPFLPGEVAMPYVMGASGGVFSGMSGSAANNARRAAFGRIVAGHQTGIYEQAFANVQQRAVQYATLVNNALLAAPVLATVFPTSALGTQLKTVARMIGSRDRLGMSRQVFFVATGGFDTHDAQLANQPRLLSDVSASLLAFYQATVELGVSANVTTFTHSDFGRTLTSNGDGSDHAWGGIQLVVGDSVRGRAFYGDYPLLEIGCPEDVGGGRMIPTVSSDQYAATLARWFGVDAGSLSVVAPNLANFAQHDLDFMLPGPGAG